jgi:hypothetical protein
MRHPQLIGKCSLIAGAAMALSFAAAPVHAQGVPPGSYLRTCAHVAIYGDRLTADCRRMDGSWGRTALRHVDRCVGDIGNMDGQLACNRADQSYGSSQARDSGPPPVYGPGYGSSGDYGPHRGEWPPAGYPPDYGR